MADAETGAMAPDPVKKRAERKPLVRWEHLVWAIVHCEHARLACTIGRSGQRTDRTLCASAVCDRAISNRIERVEPGMCGMCEQGRMWLHKRLAQWEDRSLVTTCHPGRDRRRLSSRTGRTLRAVVAAAGKGKPGPAGRPDQRHV